MDEVKQEQDSSKYDEENTVKLEGEKGTKRRRISQDTYKSLETKDSGGPVQN